MADQISIDEALRRYNTALTKIGKPHIRKDMKNWQEITGLMTAATTENREQTAAEKKYIREGRLAVFRYFEGTGVRKSTGKQITAEELRLQAITAWEKKEAQKAQEEKRQRLNQILARREAELRQQKDIKKASSSSSSPFTPHQSRTATEARISKQPVGVTKGHSSNSQTHAIR